MNQIELRDVLKSQESSQKPQFGELQFVVRLRVAWRLVRLQASLIFSHRFVWFLLGLAAFHIAAYIINYQEDAIGRINQVEILPVIFYMPLFVVAIFLNMQLITSEKDNRTLEIMFTTAGARYRVWLIKIATLNSVLLAIVFGVSVLSFFIYADIDIFWTAIYAAVPIFLVGSVTLYFAIRLRSGLAAGMVSAIAIFFLLMFNGILEEADLWRYMPFLNPFSVPRSVDPETWDMWTWQNKTAYFLVGIAMVFAALRGMENRERLLR